MNNYQRWNQDFLIFQKRSRIAILSIVVIGVLIILGVKWYYSFCYPLSELKAELTPLEKKQIALLDKRLESKKQKAQKWRVKVPSQKFNPNHYTREDWMELGYSEKQAQSVINYKKSGFEFKVKSDLKKLFIMDNQSYKELYPYIDLPDTLFKAIPNVKNELPVKEETTLSLSINEIDKEEFMRIKGVGDYYASKVLNFRNALGGFVNLDQLYEVYHLPDSVVDQISSHLTVDTNFVNRRNINKINLKELKQHPYISYKLANSIIAFRKTHGAYSSVEELKELVLMDAETFQKVRPYLKVE